jgi:WD40 repeat protein
VGSSPETAQHTISNGHLLRDDERQMIRPKVIHVSLILRAIAAEAGCPAKDHLDVPSKKTQIASENSEMGIIAILRGSREASDVDREGHAMKSPWGLLALTTTLVFIPAGSAIGRGPAPASPAEARVQQKSNTGEEKAPSKPAADDAVIIQGKTVDEWLAALKDRDPAKRKRAVAVVGGCAADPDVPENEKTRLQTALVSLLSDKDEQVRREAAFYSDLFRFSGSAEAMNRLLEEHRRTVDPTRRVIRLVDADGRPVQGAVASSFFSRDADREPSFTAAPPSEMATSNARGQVALTLEIPSHLDAAGIYAIRPHDGRPLVGVGNVTREELDKPITIVMHPACRVRLRVECPGFRELEEKFHVELDGPDWWRAAYVWLGDNHRAARPLFTSSTRGELEFLLPPGRYMIMAYGTDVKIVDRIIEVQPGHRLLHLGIIETSPSDALTQGDFQGFWRSVHRDAKANLDEQAGEEHFTFRRPRFGRRLKGETREARDLAYSPDGKLLATAHSYNADPGEVKLWDPTTGTQLATLSVPDGSVQRVAFTADGKFLAGRLSLPDDPRSSSAVVLWDVASRGAVRTIGGPAGPFSAMALAPDGRVLATLGKDRAVRFWDVASGAETRRIDGIGSGAVLAFAPDGRTLAMNGAGGAPILWDIPGNRLRATLEAAGEPFTLRSVAFAPNGQTLAAAGSVPRGGSRVRLYDLTQDPPTRRAECTFHVPERGRLNVLASDIAFAPDGRRVVGAMMDTIVIWDAQTGLERDSLHRQMGSSGDRLAVSPDGRWLAVTQPGGNGVSFLDISPSGP